MITILFFARIREQLGVDKLTVPLLTETTSVATLIQQLISSNDKLWSEVLGGENVLKAVNQAVVEDSYLLSDGDEVAFFPPMTGG